MKAQSSIELSDVSSDASVVPDLGLSSDMPAVPGWHSSSDSHDIQNYMDYSSSSAAVFNDNSRLPPHNIEAEQALLGGLLHNNMAHERVCEFLKPVHFADPTHAKIYEAVDTLIQRGRIADPVTLKDYFEKDEGLQEVGGSRYLAQLAASALTIVNVEDYGRQIYDLYMRRQLIDVGESIINGAHTYDIDEDSVTQIEVAEKKLFELATEGQQERGFVSFDTALKDAIKSAELAFKSDQKLVGITSGFTDLDNKLGGLHKSDLLIVAGRPAMGKTAFATNIAFNAALAHLNGHPNGGSVAFFSLEMSAEQLANRLLGQESKISSDKIRRGIITEAEFKTFTDVSTTLSKLKLFIDDTPALSVMALRARCRRLMRQEGLNLIVIDYLQLLSGGGTRKSQENRVQELSEITRGLKAIAKELNVPVIALSQLSRAVELRDDKRPQLSDLRESGSIEQDADVVMFVYRDEYYLQRKKPKEPAEGDDDKVKKAFADWQLQMSGCSNVAEIIIAKQRHGPVGTVDLHFDGAFTKFSNLKKDVVNSNVR